MYLRHAEGFGQSGGGTIAARPSAAAALLDRPAIRRGIDRAAQIDLVVDLGQRIGSREWWRGLVTCLGLCATALSFAPGIRPLPGRVAPRLGEAQQQEMRVQAIAPRAYGADTGRRIAATDLVERLGETPERPQISLTASLGSGDGFARVLERAGVGDDQARAVAAMVSAAVPLGEIKPGTRLDLTLGRRPDRSVARPLDHLAFRATFELALAVERVGADLRLIRKPIAVDETPLRIQGRVGGGLFGAARAAGAPAEAIETYLRALGQHLSIGRDVHAGDRFDMIVAHRRAATGETQTGALLFAGLDQGRKALRLLKWQSGGREQWFDAAGVGTQRGQMKTPVQGHLTSRFGMRSHPILGYSRMHQGIDYGAPMGSPIISAADGVVSYAGFHGGHGKFVQIRHAGGLGTGYAHMSRIIARIGQHVAAGQLIGYVGSTGLSTGPHLHFEVYRNNAVVNPASVKFTQAAQLAGAELARFRATLARLMAVRVAG